MIDSGWLAYHIEPLRCQHCGALLDNSHLQRRHSGRPKTKFCSRTCQEAWYAGQDKAERAKLREGRTCVVCGGPNLYSTQKAMCCSRKCSNDWQNHKKQAAKLERWERDKKPCAFCGGVIGHDRRRMTLYCSPGCKRNAASTRHRQRAPLYMRQYLYGIEPERYAALLESQGGRCAICRTDTPGGKGGWHLDHDHATGAIRGLLCHRCNLGLGYLRDNREVVLAAIAYLRPPGRLTVTKSPP